MVFQQKKPRKTNNKFWWLSTDGWLQLHNIIWS
jgi:hypothetical protein